MRPATARVIDRSKFPTLSLVLKEQAIDTARDQANARLELWLAKKLGEEANESASRIISAVRCRNV